MATLYIAEFARSDFQGLSHAQAAFAPAIATQTVAITGVSTQSVALNDATALIRLETDTICSFAIGASPAATTSSSRLAADQTEYFSVKPGGGLKVAVIANA